MSLRAAAFSISSDTLIMGRLLSFGCVFVTFLWQVSLAEMDCERRAYNPLSRA
jgi:hypothetical protein